HCCVCHPPLSRSFPQPLLLLLCSYCCAGCSSVWVSCQEHARIYAKRTLKMAGGNQEHSTQSYNTPRMSVTAVVESVAPISN
ncbi:hypothetical protein PAXRUDRAFT_393303, partial [Paxillus rubicundulus Ve08.2h10]